MGRAAWEGKRLALDGARETGRVKSPRSKINPR